MRCDAMRCDAMRCDAMRCDAMRCDAMRCDAMRCEYYSNIHCYGYYTKHDQICRKFQLDFGTCVKDIFNCARNNYTLAHLFWYVIPFLDNHLSFRQLRGLLRRCEPKTYISGQVIFKDEHEAVFGLEQE